MFQVWETRMRRLSDTPHRLESDALLVLNQAIAPTRQVRAG